MKLALFIVSLCAVLYGAPPITYPAEGINIYKSDQGKIAWDTGDSYQIFASPMMGLYGTTILPVAVNSDGSLKVQSGGANTNVNVHDASGNSINSTSGSLNVNVTNTVPVSVPGSIAVTQSGTWNVGINAGNNAIGSVTVSNFPATQPVSGTITANQGTSPWVISGTVTANAGTGTFQTNVTNSSLPVTQSGSWSVTANAGTNLNTSALALDTSVNGILLSQGSSTSGVKGPLIQGAVTASAPTYTTAQTSPLSLTTSGALRTDSSGSTQPISGTVTANQGGTWTVQPGNTANTTAWLVTGTGGTFPATQSGTWSTGRTWTLSNSTDSVNIGNFPATQAVTQSTSPWVVSGTVTSNIGTTGGLALDATVANVQGSASGGTAGAKSDLVGGIYNSSAPTLTNGQQASLQLDASGNLKTTGTSTISGTVTANQGTSPWVDNISQFGGSNVVTGTGNSGAGIPRVTVSNDSSITNITGTISLPTGAATSANQSSEITNLATIITNTSNINTSIQRSQGPGTVAGTPSLVSDLIGGVYNSTLPTLTSGQQIGLQTDSSGRLLTTISNSSIPVTQSGTWNVNVSNFPSTQVVTNASIGSIGSTPPTSATYIGGSVTTSSPSYTTGQMNAFSLTTAGALRVDGSATTQPVSLSVLPMTTERTASGNITAACPISVQGSIVSCPAGSTVQISSIGSSVVQYGTQGTWVATMTQDISYDSNCSTSPNSVVWYNIGSYDTDPNTNSYLINWGFANNQDPWVIQTSGTQCVRLRAQAYTSGTVAVQLDAGQGSYPNLPLIAYNSTLPTLTTGQTSLMQADSNGRLLTAAPSVSSSSLTNVSNATTSTSILSANPNRKGLILYNNATGTSCNVAFAATASNTAFTFNIAAGSTYVMSPPIYQGAISDICTAASGTMRVTEF